MSYEPSASVVLAARNAASTIDACVRSLLALRYPSEKLELIVVDNGSHDGTAGIVSRHGIRVVREAVRGAAAARNAGVAAAGGKVVAFTDADGVVDPDWLRHLVAPLADRRVGVAGGAIRALGRVNGVERFGERIHDQQRSIEVLEPPYVASASWASRRELLLELGGFDVRFRRGQDVDLSYRVVQAGYSLAFVPNAVVYHRNEHRLAGLVREGFVHGFHGVRVRRCHERFLRGYGHGRSSRPTYAEVAARLAAGIRGDRTALCDGAFNCGKKAGKLCGSVRFGHLDL